MDDGRGTNAEALGRACEPLLDSKSASTGFGMPGFHRIVGRRRGRVTIHSEPGGSNRVTIWRPDPPRAGDDARPSR